MKNWKKGCAGLLVAAMAAGSILPAGTLTVEAAAENVELPAAKYEMNFENTLDVTGAESAAVAYTQGRGSVYTEPITYVEGHTGFALDTLDQYGVALDGLSLGDSYTISVWTKLSGNLAEHSPVISASNPADTNNWLTLAGTQAGTPGVCKLWHTGNVEAGRANYPTGEWVNYTLSVDGTTATLYANGEPVIKNTDSRIKINNDSKNISFGVNYWGGDDVPNCLFDDVKIYDDALSAAQAQALYEGAGFSVYADVSYVRPGKTTELTAEKIGYEEDAVIWETSNPEVASVDDNGVVTGISEGTAEITGKILRDESEIASSTVQITVLPAQGNLIAEFTFDDEETGFSGAGAVAEKANEESGLEIVSVEGRGNVLQINSEPNKSFNWLNVTKNDGSSLLTGVKEFTVSYDSSSNGTWQNVWTFFADQPGVAASDRHYIGIADYRATMDVERYNESINGLDDGIDDFEWKHVDVVFSEYKTEVYINGVLCGSRDNSHTVEESLGENSFVMIGKATWGNEYWNGKLDNYKIYDYALTAEEIAAIPVSSVEVTAESDTVYAGNTVQMSATAAPEEATDKSVAWTSSNPEIASVDENGLVTTKAAGNVTITATAKDKDGKSGSMELTVKAALEYHESTEANCSTDGNLEYWSDAEGNLYADAEGKISTSLEEIKIPATGHDYRVTWDWSKNDDDYTATASFVCKVCQLSDTVSAEMTKESSGGTITYEAIVEFDGQKYSMTKEVAESLTLNVVGGVITSGEKETYSYADMVTVTADESRDGKYFSGWYVNGILVSEKRTYTFYVLDNMTVTAEYAGDEILEESPIVSLNMSEREITDESGKERLPITVQWSVPSNCTVVEIGIVRSYTVGNSEELIVEAVDGASIRKNTVPTKSRNGSYILGLNMSAATAANPVYAKGYVTYSDSTGAQKTVYSNMLISEPN